MPTEDALSASELARYARHLTLPEVGIEGQRRLKASSALIVGAGGLGSPLGLYLAAAGVGRLGIVDFDRVDASNLQRQVLYETRHVGRSKVEIAAERLRGLNPDIRVEPHDRRLDADNVLDLVGRYDVIVDGTDNFGTRYLVNDACVLTGVPNVYGSIFRFEGQVSRFGDPGGPCYRCLYPEPPPPGEVPNCAEGGVLGILPGLVGTLQATEAIKGLLGIGRSLSGRLLLIDALDMRIRELTVARDPGCPVCGDRPTIDRPVEASGYCEATSAAAEDAGAWSVERLRDRLDRDPPALLDVREPFEWEIGRLPGAMHVPLGEVPSRVDELPRDRTLVVYCKSGARSARAVAWLTAQGFADVHNLTGGWNAWAERIDPGLPTY